MLFRLTPMIDDMDDLELLHVRIFSVFLGISQIWYATTAKRMKIFDKPVLPATAL